QQGKPSANRGRLRPGGSSLSSVNGTANRPPACDPLSVCRKNTPISVLPKKRLRSAATPQSPSRKCPPVTLRVRSHGGERTRPFARATLRARVDRSYSRFSVYFSRFH